MKKPIIAVALLASTTSAFAQVEHVNLCKVDRNGKIISIDFQVKDKKVILTQDGFPVEYDIESASDADLIRATAVCGGKITQATDYVLKSPQGTTKLQVVISANGSEYLVYPDKGPDKMIGASTDDCEN